MSAVLCLPACLCVSAAASCGQAPHGNASPHPACGHVKTPGPPGVAAPCRGRALGRRGGTVVNTPQPVHRTGPLERVVEENGVPPTRASLHLKDLDNPWVPMQLEMEKDLDCDNQWVVCCGYDAMLLRGSELDDAPRSEWTKATRPGWRMLIMPPQLPGEDDISLVAVKKN